MKPFEKHAPSYRVRVLLDRRFSRRRLLSKTSEERLSLSLFATHRKSQVPTANLLLTRIMSGLLHDFISSLESPDSWDNVNKVLADIQSTYPKSPFLATKIKDIKDLLEPSWSRISVSLRRCLRERLSKILDETRHKKLTVYQTTERLVSLMDFKNVVIARQDSKISNRGSLPT